MRSGPGSSQLKREGAGQANKQLQHPATAPERGVQLQPVWEPGGVCAPAAW